MDEDTSYSPTSIVHLLFGCRRVCICICLTIRMEVHAPENILVGHAITCKYRASRSSRGPGRESTASSPDAYTRDLNHRGRSLSNINIIFSKHIHTSRQHRIMNRYAGVILLFLVTLLGTLSTAVFTATIPGFSIIILLICRSITSIRQ